MAAIPTHTLSIGMVASVIDRSVDRVRQLDDELKPVRDRSGQRKYDPIVVAQYVATHRIKGFGHGK